MKEQLEAQLQIVLLWLDFRMKTYLKEGDTLREKAVTESASHKFTKAAAFEEMITYVQNQIMKVREGDL